MDSTKWWSNPSNLPTVCEAESMSRDLSRRRVHGGPGRNGRFRGLRHTLSGPAPSVSVSQDPNDKSVVWANWTLYLDYNRKRQAYPTLERGSRSRPASPSSTARTSTTTCRSTAMRTTTGPRDGHRLRPWTPRLADRPWIKKGWAAPLDKANIPNSVNLLPELEDVPFDPVACRIR